MLRYNNYYFVGKLEDIPEIPAVVAIPSTQVDLFAARGGDIETLSVIKDLAGKDLWHVLHVQ
jgi:hypothetical protein